MPQPTSWLTLKKGILRLPSGKKAKLNQDNRLPQKEEVNKNMAIFVMVPGGWSGGKVYKGVARLLKSQGHEVYTPTLTGVAERGHLMASNLNLDTHIRDIIELILWENLNEVILCGHSYGGMVITGVADSIPERIAGLVYLDAYVPANGESCWELTTEAFRRMFIVGAAANGYASAPPTRPGSELTAQPLASFIQKITLVGNYTKIAQKVYVLATNWDGSPFPAVYERCLVDPTWITRAIDCGHNIMRERPEELAALLNDLAN